MPAIHRTIWRFLISRDLALVLLVVLLFFSLARSLGSPGPAQPDASPAKVIQDYAFDVAGLLLVLNLLFCSIQRVTQELRPGRVEHQPDLQNLGGLRHQLRLENAGCGWSTGEPLRVGETLLRSRGYRTVFRGHSSLVAGKGWGGRWGSILYHLSFLVVLAGLFIINRHTFEGLLIITEGQTFTDRDRLAAAHGLLDFSQPVKIRLDKFEMRFEGDNVVDAIAHLGVNHGARSNQAHVRVNYPLRIERASFLLQSYGFAPNFVLKDGFGEVLFDGLVNLMVAPAGKEDAFRPPELPVEIKVKLYPDATLDEGKVALLSRLPSNPLMWVEVWQGQNKLAEGYLRPNEELSFGWGKVSYTEVRYWLRFLVTQEGKPTVLMAGFFLALLGVAVRIVRSEKTFYLLLADGATLYVGGKSELYNQLFFVEFQQVSEELRKALT